MSKIDVAARLERLAGEIRGEGEWPKFTHIADGTVFEYSSRCRWRAYFQGSWGPWDEAPGSAWMNIGGEAEITPAEAARLTGGGVERREVYVATDGVLTYVDNEGDECDLDYPPTVPCFIGYLYLHSDGTEQISTRPRMAVAVGQNTTPASIPVAVLFVKE